MTASAGWDGTLRPDADGVAVFDDLSAVESLWRALETTGIGSPYQRFDWVRAYTETCAAPAGIAPRIVVLLDAGGRPAALLPLGIVRRGVAIASFLGGKHANFKGPLLATPDAISASDLTRRLVALGRGRLGVDLFSFTNMPVALSGAPNPLAIDGRPSPSDAYGLALMPSGDDLLERTLSKGARKKMRNKERVLSALGPLQYRVAGDEADVSALVAAFLQQKHERFRSLGLPNPFAGAEVEAFLVAAGRAGLAEGRPAIEWHGLMVGDRVAAVFGAAVDARRCSGMVISFDPNPLIAKTSPGDILLQHVLRANCAAGLERFDLGVGEARYKDALCPEVEPLVDRFLPVTAKGQAAAPLFAAAQHLKRKIKRSPQAWSLVERARKLLAHSPPAKRSAA
ncbi:MAG TPA: GNAT family N-acetyltransferase [Beijerinckiaceae bacterium]